MFQGDDFPPLYLITAMRGISPEHSWSVSPLSLLPGETESVTRLANKSKIVYVSLMGGTTYQKSRRVVVIKLISQQSQISIIQRLKFLLKAKFLKLILLLMPLLQHRLAQAVVFCGRATLKGPKSYMWLTSCSLPTTALGNHWPLFPVLLYLGEVWGVNPMFTQSACSCHKGDHLASSTLHLCLGFRIR
uniref:Uncharacterized protein n=1 Tax=Pipistrellus kuhlii TaxID=59472 RepID=A0A7J7ZIR5_PIPKU|nr:hypothetical protein mPipKuh1_009386 [Pipistrellus kuhlii]